MIGASTSIAFTSRCSHPIAAPNVCYRATAEVVAASEVPVLAVPAQRELRRAREMRINDDQ
jgi:hypothetical protein